jgi:hypothetical protein
MPDGDQLMHRSLRLIYPVQLEKDLAQTVGFNFRSFEAPQASVSTKARIED